MRIKKADSIIGNVCTLCRKKWLVECLMGMPGHSSLPPLLFLLQENKAYTSGKLCPSSFVPRSRFRLDLFFQNQEVKSEINLIIILVTKISKWRLMLPITENCKVRRVSWLGGNDDEFGLGCTKSEWSRKLETWGGIVGEK